MTNIIWTHRTALVWFSSKECVNTTKYEWLPTAKEWVLKPDIHRRAWPQISSTLALQTRCLLAEEECQAPSSSLSSSLALLVGIQIYSVNPQWHEPKSNKMGNDQKTSVEVKKHSCEAKARADSFTVDLNRLNVSSVLLLKELIVAFQSLYWHISDFADSYVALYLKSSKTHQDSQLSFGQVSFFTFC